jgi:predicted aspartyl protease
MHNIHCLAGIILMLISMRTEADDCHIERQASLPITFNGFVPTIPAHINRQLVSIGIDTGSSTTVLTPETVARLNLPPATNSHLNSFIGSNGNAEANNVFLDTLEFGHAVEMMKSVPVIAIGGSHKTSSPGAIAASTSPDSTMAGLIGTEILSDYDVEFRFPAHILNLYRVSNCDKVTPPWEGEYTTIPITLSETKRFVVPLELDGHPVTAIFDTGSSGLRISRSAALRLGVTEAMLAQDPVQQGERAGNKTYEVPLHQFAEIKIGREAFPGPRIDVVNFPLTESDMLIGEDYMHARRFWLSYSTKRLFIQRLRMLPVRKQHFIGHIPTTPLTVIGQNK